MNKNETLLVCISTHDGDFTNAENLIKWIGELEGKLPFPALIVVDQTVAQERYVELFKQAREVFSHVRLITAQVSQSGWKPNKMFLVAAQYVRDNYSCPFLWLEPDCVPLKSGWLADINQAYHESPLRYMGAIIEQTGQKGLPPKHLTGCSVYPNDAVDTFDKMSSVTGGREAWDIAGGEKIATAAQNTPLIQHFWGEPTKWPVFVETRAADAPDNHVTLDFLKPDAVLFHRCKMGDLIPILRNGRQNLVPAAPPTQIDSTGKMPNFQIMSESKMKEVISPEPVAVEEAKAEPPVTPTLNTELVKQVKELKEVYRDTKTSSLLEEIKNPPQSEIVAPKKRGRPPLAKPAPMAESVAT